MKYQDKKIIAFEVVKGMAPLGIVAVLIIIAVAALWRWYAPISETQSLVRTEAKRVISQINRGNVSIKPVVGLKDPQCDAWDKPLHYAASIDKYVLTVTCTSNGRDGIQGTADDIQGTAQDFNKSRMVGEYVGTKWKQAKKGFIDGLKKKSPFDKNESSD